MIATGVRWDESRNRANRGGYETLMKNKADRVILSDDDIHEMIETVENELIERLWL